MMNKYLITFTVYDVNNNSFVYSDNLIFKSEKIDEYFIEQIKKRVLGEHLYEYNYCNYFVVINNIIKLDE